MKYNKLVRDKIPTIIEQSGKISITQQLDDEEYLTKLKEKLGEELKEYLSSGKIEELADLVEVVYAILDYSGVSLEEFEGIRYAKLHERGAFKERILLKEVRS